MFKTAIKVVGAWIVLETGANLGKGYMLGCMEAINPDSEDVAYCSELLEDAETMSCIAKIQAKTIKIGKELGKSVMEEKFKF